MLNVKNYMLVISIFLSLSLKLSGMEGNSSSMNDENEKYRSMYLRLFNVPKDLPISWQEAYQKQMEIVSGNEEKIKVSENFPVECSFDAMLSGIELNCSPANLQFVTARHAVFIKFSAEQALKTQRMGVCWRNSDLTGANLKAGDFRSTLFHYVKIENCNFTDANLSDLNLKGSSFRNNNLTRANLHGVLMDGDGEDDQFTTYKGCYVMVQREDGADQKKELTREDLKALGVCFENENVKDEKPRGVCKLFFIN